MSSSPSFARIITWLMLSAALVLGPALVETQASSLVVETAVKHNATALAAQPNLAPCYWGYYPGGGGAFTPLRSDADAVTPGSLRVGSFFRSGSGSLASTGSLDFDADGKTDIFRFKLRTDNLYHWQYSAGGTSDWVDLAYDSTMLNNLRFGDFDGDGYTDVFTATYDSGARLYRWYISYRGVGSYTQVNTSIDGPFWFKVGDFNADGRADIFDAEETPPDSRNYRWRYSSGATAAFVNLASDTVLPRDLRLGDFNGDGKTDVFAARSQGNGSYQWVYSSGGVQSYQDLARTSHATADLQFGDVDGDGTTDVLAQTVQANGQAEWAAWPGGLGEPAVLQTGPASIPYLGDFDGDGRADAFLTNCSAQPRFTRLPKHAVEGFASDASYQPYVADVNGDGRQDLLWSSSCQGDGGRCTRGHNLVAVSLSNGQGGFTPVPSQILDTSRNWNTFRRFPGEANGDGKADLLFIATDDNVNAGEVSIYTAIWNGGGYTLSSRMSLGSALGGYNAWAADFTGDGLTDFVLDTVCIAGNGLDSIGCYLGSNNNVYLAVNKGGTFTIGPLQSLGTGWSSYNTYLGDVNGDGRTDLIWNSTCQRLPSTSFDCDAGTANYVYTGVSNGTGGIILSQLQTYGTSGWGDFQTFIGDFNGDGRTDMAWYSSCPGRAHCKLSENQLRVGLANPDGTFQVSAVQSFGQNDWSGWNINRGDVNGDGKDDLIWSRDVTVDQAGIRQVRVAISNGDATFALQPTEHVSYSSIPVTRYLVGDLTGDDEAELIWYFRDQPDVDVLLNGSPSPPNPSPSPSSPSATVRTFLPMTSQ